MYMFIDCGTGVFVSTFLRILKGADSIRIILFSLVYVKQSNNIHLLIRIHK